MACREALKPNDPAWFGERCHVSSLMEACVCEPPVMALQGNCKPEMLVPPENETTPGRPKMRHSEAGLRGGSTRFGDCLLSQTCPEAREQHSGWFDLLSEPLSLCTDHWQTAKALTKAWWCMACWIAEDGGCCLSSL